MWTMWRKEKHNWFRKLVIAMKNKRYKREAKRLIGHCLSLKKEAGIFECACFDCKYDRMMGCKYDYLPGETSNFRRLEKLLKR